jgi:hypothetical protein
MSLSITDIGEICKGIGMLPVSRKRNALQNWLDIDVRSWFAGRILPVTESMAECWDHVAASAKQRGIAVAVVEGVIAAGYESPGRGARASDAFHGPARPGTDYRGRGAGRLALSAQTGRYGRTSARG